MPIHGKRLHDQRRGVGAVERCEQVVGVPPRVAHRLHRLLEHLLAGALESGCDVAEGLRLVCAALPVATGLTVVDVDTPEDLARMQAAAC